MTATTKDPNGEIVDSFNSVPNLQPEISSDESVPKAPNKWHHMKKIFHHVPQNQRTSTTDSASQMFADDEDLFKISPDKIEFINNNNTNSNQAIIDSNHEDDSSLFVSNNDLDIIENNNNYDDEDNFDVSTITRRRQALLADDTSSSLLSYLATFLVNQSGENNQLSTLASKLAPQVSCYLGIGNTYVGNQSTSSDGRLCLNWQVVFASLDEQTLFKHSTFDRHLVGNHNYCRNPNGDHDGPWCFVPYVDESDKHEINKLLSTRIALPEVESKSRLYQRQYRNYVARQCLISKCSSILWMSIVLPSVCLIFVCSCIILLSLKAYRNLWSCNGRAASISSPKKQSKKSYHKSERLSNLRKALSGRRLLKCRTKNRKSQGHFGNNNSSDEDDVFAIIDDWTSEMTQSSSSMSPKSSESIKMKNSNSREIPYICNNNLSSKVLPSKLSTTSDLLNLDSGMTFATLRCPAITDSKKDPELGQGPNQSNHNNKLNNDKNQQKKKLTNFKSTTMSNISFAMTMSSNKEQQQQNQKQPENSTEGLIKLTELPLMDDFEIVMDGNASLVECSNSKLNDINDNTKTTNATASMPKVLFDGKFARVNLNKLLRKGGKQNRYNDCSSKESSNDSHDINKNKHSYLRRQEDCEETAIKVAMLEIKQSMNLDVDRLQVRVLSHLNITKLAGFMQQTDHKKAQTVTTYLVYDMSNMSDLTDWLKLKQQAINHEAQTLTNRDTIIVTLRRDLACIGKQIALALDYLHDNKIVFMDLACRSCFIDASRVHVKLASFNLQFVGKIHDNNDYNSNIASSKSCNFAFANNNDAEDQNSNDNNNIDCIENYTVVYETENNFDSKSDDDDCDSRNGFRSLVRPNYLDDYYIIETRPSHCQLLPLASIPLESILFNKFSRSSDIWSFGCLLYELYSLGQACYFGYSSKQVIDAIRSNLMPPKPLLCPDNMYRLMCQCLCDIPTNRPTIKQVYEQLNSFSGFCSSFLDHNKCAINQNQQVVVNIGDRNQTQAATSIPGFDRHMLTKGTQQFWVTNQYDEPFAARSDTRIEENVIELQ